MTGVVSGSVTSTTWQRVRVAEQLEHLVGLGAHRPAAHGVEQPGGRREERDGVAGGRAVDDDDVPLAAALELLDLAEHDDVVDARRGRGHDVDHAGRRQPLGDPPEAVLAEVLLEGGRRRDRLARQAADQLGEDRLAVELDDEHALAGVGGRSGQTAVTVVLPTPPLPATIVTREAVSTRHWIDELRRHLCAD